jgi:hypothetical protein
VPTAAPRTIKLLEISTEHAWIAFVTAGQNIERFRGENSCSMLCDANPLPASSGKTSGCRLIYGGDRQVNHRCT